MKLSIIILLIAFHSYECAIKIPTLKLNNGHEMPLLGLGTFTLRGEAAYNAVKEAIDVGYRHIDTSDDYGNEEEIGKAVNEAIKGGKAKREEFFIVTKVTVDNLSASQTVEVVKKSLNKLNLTYVDLELIHRTQVGFEEPWKGLEDAVAQGLTKSIGLSNFHEDDMARIFKVAKIKPVNLQNGMDATNPSDGIIKYCHEHNMTITSYSPLGAGHKVDNELFTKIGTHYNKTGAQVMLRFQVQRDVIVIPRSAKREHLIENTQIFDWKLSDADMKEIHH
jgi:diketogulonate reductase-like aldo/keto reductase